ncbi:MAG: esterase [Fibrobacter sp.]|nr:esterase [Fibrobacter sp.]
MRKSVWEPLALACAMAVSASAFTLTGKVSDDQGGAVSGAAVSLVKKGLSTTTDDKGEFKFHEDEMSIMGRVLPGYISVNNGVLSFSQRSSEPVQVQIFDMMGNRLLSETLYGSGSLDLQACVKAQGSYYANVKIGSAQRSIRFTSNGNYGSSYSGNAKTALKRLTVNETLKVIADGYDTLSVVLNNLDTNLALTLKKQKQEPQYAYGWGLKNDPVPTRGCGKTWSRVKSGSYDFQWSKGKRTIRIDIPDNYDNKKPYRLVFGMHCMGGWAGGVQQEGYYGLKPLDTEKTTIFVAPEGNGNQAPWGQDDYLLFDELLADLQSNLCIDSSRVFSTGFSYGSMFSNGLSWNHQDVLRAVAVYETAERNIWLPQRQNKGVGWMGVLGLDDNLCTPEMGRAARDIILTLNSEGGKAKNEQAEEAPRNSAHKCYDYKTVEERFPVRWCTQSGGHIWDHKDPGSNQSWVPKATWEFINKF